MKKEQLFACAVFTLMIILPVAGAVIEEEWGNYIRIDEDRRDGAGQDITLSWMRKTYNDPEENYTVTVTDFDAGGSVVLVITYNGRNETFLLSGTWDENRTRVILPETIEAFDKTMNISTIRIVPPAGVFTCCPEVQIKVNLIRPELFLEFDEDIKTDIDYKLVNPYSGWNISVDRDSPYKSPFDSSIETDKNTTNERHNAYRKNDDIPMEITITNFGDAQASGIVLYIDTDGLLFEEGKAYTDLPSLGGEKQVGFNGETKYLSKFKLRFPSYPEKLNYTVHAYIKGEKNGITYYYDDIKVIHLLPSVGIQKSVTKESLLMNRKDVESIYPSIDSDEITRWLQSGDIFVNLGVTNYENYGINNVNLYDTLHKQFILENQSSMNWTFNLNPGETKDFTYKILTDRPGTFTLPSALLTYSDLNMTWNVISNNPSTQVHGPCIQMFKKPDKPVITIGNNTNITIDLRNIGDMPSRVIVNDSIPENSTLLEGKTSYEGVILPRDSVIFSYMISMDSEGQIELPNPVLYINGRKSPVCGELLTSRILVQKYTPPRPAKTVIVPTETPVEVKSPEEIKKDLLIKYNWLEGVIPAFMLVLAIAVLYMLYRKNL